jgi:putative hydrolase of HD superfamily
MAIVHDLAEAIVGDISPHCGVSIMPLPSSPLRLVLRCHAPALHKCLTMLAALQVSDEEKFRRESEAMAAIRSATGDSEVGREIERLWKEYEAGETPEAKGVKVGASATSSVLVHLAIIIPSRSKRNMSYGHEI